MSAGSSIRAHWWPRILSLGCSVRPKERSPRLSSTVLGADAPPMSFAELGLPNALVDVLRRQGITQPLPIQSATIVDAMAGRDVSGMAPTGSGKTLAFALPMAAKLSRAHAAATTGSCPGTDPRAGCSDRHRAGPAPQDSGPQGSLLLWRGGLRSPTQRAAQGRRCRRGMSGPSRGSHEIGRHRSVGR